MTRVGFYIRREAPKFTTILGLATVAITFYGAANLIPPFYSHMYPFAWYGLILFLDGILWWRWDESLIFKRFPEFITLCFWSAMFWFFFEVWNLRLQNWYYVGTPDGRVWPHIEAYIDFATVLPGMFLLYRLLCKLNIPKERTGKRLPATHVTSISTLIGTVMLGLAAAFPDYFFPFVWGAFIFLLEPLLAKTKAPSLLRNAVKGQWTPFFRLLTAGLLAGIYWELCNFWSLEKWVYTVPFFAEGKLFEMPYLGFLGFPPFCVECFVMTNAVYLLRAGKHWNPEWHYRSRHPRRCRIAYVVLIGMSICLAEWSYDKMHYHTVDSRAETLPQAVDDIDATIGRLLYRNGWKYPQSALNDWNAAATLIPGPLRERFRRRLELVTLLHMGSKNARLLERIGIRTRSQLAGQNPNRLLTRLARANRLSTLRKRPLLKRRVLAWVNAARRKSVLY